MLREAGWWAEGLVLESPGLIGWSAEQLEQGRCLTVVDPCYPCRWLRVLGAGAPPALWKVGDIPSLPSLSVVGSRSISAPIRRFCAEVGRQAVSAGYCVVSGGAAGCDRAAVSGATKAGGCAIEILPHGICQRAHVQAACLLSVTAPDEVFSAANAMERNALIYAASSHTVIGQARHKEGGTWHGAIHAVRSRLSTLIIRRSNDLAMRSLAALGGVRLERPEELSLALKHPGPQPHLFDNAC